MRRDLHSNIKVVQHIAAAVVSATVTPASGVDLDGFDSAELVIAIGTAAGIATGGWDFKLQESDSLSTGFTDVTTAGDVLYESAASPVQAPDGSTGVFLTVDAAAEDEATYRVGYIGSKRYVRVVATATGSPGNTPLSVSAVLSHAHLVPTSDG